MGAFEQRARRRRERAELWPIRAYAVADEPEVDARDLRGAGERLAAVWELSERAWALSGREMPRYERGAIPGRVLRAEEPAE